MKFKIKAEIEVPDDFGPTPSLSLEESVVDWVKTLIELDCEAGTIKVLTIGLDYNPSGIYKLIRGRKHERL